MSDEVVREKTLLEQLTRAKVLIGAVSKAGRTTSGNIYNFRGIDAVVNAVAPVFNELGIVVAPHLLEKTSDYVTYGNNNAKGFRTVVVVRYDFKYGDEILEAIVPGEAIDAGDKSTTKAMSVAYRTALLQTLNLPTDEKDPDHDQYQVTGTQTEQQATQGESERRGPPVAEVPATDEQMAFIDDALASMNEAERHEAGELWKAASLPRRTEPMTRGQAQLATQLMMNVLDGGKGPRATEQRPSATESGAKPASKPVDPSAITKPQIGKINGMLKDAGYTDRNDVHRMVGAILKQDVNSISDLTKSQAHKVIDQLVEDAKVLTGDDGYSS
jgi:hypothetical protein